MPETNLEVCISITNLEKFNALIETLKHRMQEAGEGAARLKEVIKKFTDFKLAVQTVHAEKDCD